MLKSLLEFKDYRLFLKQKLTGDKSSRGQVAKLAQHLGCQSSFLSQVLGERCHLSFEHAEGAAQFFSFAELEFDYFMHLVHENRAGSIALKKFHRSKLEVMRAMSKEVKNHIYADNGMRESDRNIYYSQWWHAAIHILSALPSIKTRSDLSTRLGLPVNVVEETVDFLIRSELVIESPSGLTVGQGRIHLGRESSTIVRHHTNWRLKAIDLIGRPRRDDLNYSSVIGISAVDADRIRELMLKLLSSSEKILRESGEEHAYMMNLDFNRLD